MQNGGFGFEGWHSREDPSAQPFMTYRVVGQTLGESSVVSPSRALRTC